MSIALLEPPKFFPLPEQYACRIYAIALQKGGVGKTTSTINLAAALALFGFRVLVIDMDPQGNTTDGFGIKVGPDDATMYEVLTPEKSERVSLKDVIKQSECGVDVAPAHLAMAALEKNIGTGGQVRLQKQLDTLTGYHFVFIDCPPSLGELTVAALSAADEVLLAIKPGPDELKGLTQLGKTIGNVQDSFNEELDYGGVLVCDFDSRTQVARDIVARLREDWGDWDRGGRFLGTISRTTKIPESKDKSMPVHLHAPDNPASVDFNQAAVRLATRAIERSVAA